MVVGADVGLVIGEVVGDVVCAVIGAIITRSTSHFPFRVSMYYTRTHARTHAHTHAHTQADPISSGESYNFHNYRLQLVHLLMHNLIMTAYNGVHNIALIFCVICYTRQ